MIHEESLDTGFKQGVAYAVAELFGVREDTLAVEIWGTVFKSNTVPGFVPPFDAFRLRKGFRRISGQTKVSKGNRK